MIGIMLQDGAEKLIVGADYINLIWVPDTFFVNEKVARFHAATQVFFLHFVKSLTVYVLGQSVPANNSLGRDLEKHAAYCEGNIVNIT